MGGYAFSDDREGEQEHMKDDSLIRIIKQEVNERADMNEKLLDAKLAGHCDKIDESVRRLEENIQNMDKRWDERFRAMDEKWDTRLKAMDEKWDARISRIDERVDRVEKTLKESGERFEVLASEVKVTSRNAMWASVALCVTVLLGIIGIGVTFSYGNMQVIAAIIGLAK
jgi:chromosome segregation ATPase